MKSKIIYVPSKQWGIHDILNILLLLLLLYCLYFTVFKVFTCTIDYNSSISLFNPLSLSEGPRHVHTVSRPKQGPMYVYNLKQILIIFKIEYKYQPINVCDYKYKYGFFIIICNSSVNFALFVYISSNFQLLLLSQRSSGRLAMFIT